MIFYKLVFLIIVLIICVRFKIHLALSIFIVSVLAVILYHINYKFVIQSLKGIVLDINNLSTVSVIILISFLSTILTERGNFRKTFEGLNGFFGDLRIAIILMPSVIGMIPMPAGAIFSAPLVKEGGEVLEMNDSQKHLANYLSRHMWELSIPLYPAILLVNATFNIPLSVIIRSQILYTFIYAILAIFFIFYKIKNTEIKEDRNISNNSTEKKEKFLMIFKNIWPVIVIITCIISFKLNANFIIGGVLFLYIIINKLNLKEMINYFRKSFSFSIIGIVVMIIFFKNLIQTSSALENLPVVMKDMGLNPVFIIFITPFLIGFLTGLTMAPVGIIFTALYPLFFKTAGVIDYPSLMFAYVGAYMGVNLSPVHLCLAVTKEYFGVSYKDIYRRLIPFVLIFIGISFVLFLLKFPPLYVIGK